MKQALKRLFLIPLVLFTGIFLLSSNVLAELYSNPMTDITSCAKKDDEKNCVERIYYREFTFPITDDTKGTITGKLTVTPEPVSSVLFLFGGATLALRRCWKRKRN